MATKGQSGMGQDQDDVVFIPFSTGGKRKVLGVASPVHGGAAPQLHHNPAKSLRDHPECHHN